jgi:hypothetical protein
MHGAIVLLRLWNKQEILLFHKRKDFYDDTTIMDYTDLYICAIWLWLEQESIGEHR